MKTYQHNYSYCRRHDSPHIEAIARAMMAINTMIKFAFSNVLIHKGNKNELLSEWLESNEYYVHHLSMNYSNSSYHLKDRDKLTDEVLITNYEQTPL